MNPPPNCFVFPKSTTVNVLRLLYLFLNLFTVLYGTDILPSSRTISTVKIGFTKYSNFLKVIFKVVQKKRTKTHTRNFFFFVCLLEWDYKYSSFTKVFFDTSIQEVFRQGGIFWFCSGDLFYQFYLISLKTFNWFTNVVRFPVNKLSLWIQSYSSRSKHRKNERDKTKVKGVKVPPELLVVKVFIDRRIVLDFYHLLQTSYVFVVKTS